jgi:uncharacterized sulfatase
MIRWPARVKPGVSQDLAMSIDIAPTVLAALGMSPSPSMQGKNLLDDAAVHARRAIQGACFTHNAVDLNDPAKSLLWRWMIDDRWKLIVPADPSGGRRVELYDIIADPTEKVDRAAEKSDVVNGLRRKLDEWWTPGS